MELAARPYHDLHYDQADEFTEAVHGHWDTWEDDTIVQDRTTGLFAHPARVHRPDHSGKCYQSPRRFTVPRSGQGRPVINQAGSSGPGKQFAAR